MLRKNNEKTINPWLSKNGNRRTALIIYMQHRLYILEKIAGL
jgi:hypothetical protein